MVSDNLRLGFIKDFQLAVQPPLEQLIGLEYEAGKTREELTQLHSQRVEYHEVLEQKRAQIVADINQYLQSFTDTASLMGIRK